MPQGVSNAYEIVTIKTCNVPDWSGAQPYLVPDPVAMEYETPITRAQCEPENTTD